MNPKYYGLIEMAMTFGVVAIFTIYQLWSLREKPPQGDNGRDGGCDDGDDDSDKNGADGPA